MDLYKISDFFYPNTILDIGANVGQFHTLCKHYFPESYVFSIEASDECEKYLKEITNNYYIGLLAKDNNEYEFYSRKDTSIGTGNSIYKELTEYYSDENLNIIPKKGIKLDDLFTKESQFDLIKIDTQGSELDIILGGLDLVGKSKGILLEVSIVPYNHNAPLYHDVVKFMDNIRFKQAKIIEDKKTNNIHQQDILFIKK